MVKIIQAFFEKRKVAKREKLVLQRYVQLAGLVQNNQMVNRDKESRARAWVLEQENLQTSQKSEWFQTGWGQIVIGLIVTVVGGIIVTLIL